MKIVERKTMATDAGMLGIWDTSSFSHVNDYDDWDKELCDDDDILRNIFEKNYVPINVLCDGAFAVELRIGSPDTLSDREKEYVLVPSLPYALSTKGEICISSIESVSGTLKDDSITHSLPAGEYAVTAYFMDWNEEPGATDEDGNPTPNALPDFIVYLHDQTSDQTYRTDIETFRREDAQR